MLQFNVELCRIGSNYKNGCSVGVYLRRWAELACPVEFYFTGVSDVEGFIPKGTHVASTNNRLIRLRQIFAFLPLSSLKGISGGSL